jgi:hypothetical protein
MIWATVPLVDHSKLRTPRLVMPRENDLGCPENHMLALLEGCVCHASAN